MDLNEEAREVSVTDEKSSKDTGTNNLPQPSTENEEYLGGPVFEPPLYMQRYYCVEQMFEKFNVKHVVDFGSAECKIARFLVQIPTLEKLDLVDLDGNLLRSKIHAIRPLTTDYLDKRDLPLHVRILQGSVTDLDSKLLGCDAVSMVEIIEHLNPDVLQGAVEMVFGKLQPGLVMMTTPNSEFNQLFPNFTGMRHWDHKFEWTRQEMREWCEKICDCFPEYSVEYGGVGDPPVDSRHLGHCSQYAVFVRVQPIPCIDYTMQALDSYIMISESFYPFKEKILSDEEIILGELKYQIRQYQRAGVSVKQSDVWKPGPDGDARNQSIGLLPGCGDSRNQYLGQLPGCGDTRNQSVGHLPGSSDTRNQSLGQLPGCSDTRNQSVVHLPGCSDTRNQSLGQLPGCGDSRNQSVGQLPDSHSRLVCCKYVSHVHESDVDSGIQSVFHPVKNQSASNMKTLQYCVNCSRVLMEKMSRQFIPVKFLMNRTIQKKMNFEQFQTFLHNHGYDLSGDSLYIVVDCDNPDTDCDNSDTEEDEVNEDVVDDYFYTDNPTDITSCSDSPKMHSNFSSEDALINDQWDFETV